MMQIFSLEAAKEIGLIEAIILQNIARDVIDIELTRRTSQMGYGWTYCTNALYELLYPYIRLEDVYKKLKSLEEKGLILSNKNNPLYSFTLTAKCRKLMKL